MGAGERQEGEHDENISGELAEDIRRCRVHAGVEAETALFCQHARLALFNSHSLETYCVFVTWSDLYGIMLQF